MSDGPFEVSDGGFVVRLERTGRLVVRTSVPGNRSMEQAIDLTFAHLDGVRSLRNALAAVLLIANNEGSP